MLLVRSFQAFGGKSIAQSPTDHWWLSVRGAVGEIIDNWIANISREVFLIALAPFCLHVWWSLVCNVCLDCYSMTDFVAVTPSDVPLANYLGAIPLTSELSFCLLPCICLLYVHLLSNAELGCYPC